MEHCSYQEMVQTFNQEMFNQTHKNITTGIFEDCDVAVLGSGVAIKNNFSAFDKDASRLFDDFFKGFPTSDNFFTLLKHIYAKLPKRYIGVHIWVQDRPTFTCGDEHGTLYMRKCSQHSVFLETRMRRWRRHRVEPVNWSVWPLVSFFIYYQTTQ